MSEGGVDFAKIIEGIIEVRTREIMARSDKAIMLLNDTLQKMLQQLAEFEARQNHNSDMIGKFIQSQQELVALIDQTREVVEANKAETDDTIRNLATMAAQTADNTKQLEKLVAFAKAAGPKVNVEWEDE